MAFSKLKLEIHGKKFLTCNNVSSFNSKALMANLQPSSTLVDRESTHPPSRVICNLIFPSSSSHCAWQIVIRAFIGVSPPSLRFLLIGYDLMILKAIVSTAPQMPSLTQKQAPVNHWEFEMLTK